MILLGASRCMGTQPFSVRESKAVKNATQKLLRDQKSDLVMKLVMKNRIQASDISLAYACMLRANACAVTNMMVALKSWYGQAAHIAAQHTSYNISIDFNANPQ